MRSPGDAKSAVSRTAVGEVERSSDAARLFDDALREEVPDDKLARSSAPHRYVFFRSPQVPPSERIEYGINVVALPEYGR